jgi:hypothetical protein
LIINGGFDVWQRGTSFTLTGNKSTASYAADRWYSANYTSGWAVTTNTGAKVTVDNLPAFAITGNASDAGKTYIIQTLENPERLLGKSVTLSYYAKVSSGTVSVPNTIQFPSGVSQITTANPSNVTTAWTKFSHTFTIPLNHYTNSLPYAEIQLMTGVDTTGKTITFGQVQLELGNQATEFEHRSYGEELALCQRYYQKIYVTYAMTVNYKHNTDTRSNPTSFMTQMRDTPTTTFSRTDHGILISDASSQVNTPQVGWTASAVGTTGFRMVRTSINEDFGGGSVHVGAWHIHSWIDWSAEL